MKKLINLLLVVLIINLIYPILVMGNIINNDYNKLWQIYFQEEASPIMIGIRDLHDNVMFYLIIILTIVSYFLIVNIIRISSIRLIVKSRDFNHSTIVETIWTIIPAATLIIIAIPSFKLLYSMDEILKPLITLKIQGSQWYWTYNIADITGLNIEFTSYPKEVLDLNKGEFRLLEVDNRIILPILKPIRILITASDVMHAWTIPSLGVKIDAIPGRINHGLLFILREGIFYGQCSELCGQGHAYMPIVLESVKEYKFINWLLSFSDIPLSSLLKLFNIFNHS